MNRNKLLWTRNFRLITFATILSAIGGEAMVLPVSLLVFEKTQSTMASAIIMICGVLPDVLFSVLIAPMIDRSSRKKWVVFSNAAIAALYLVIGFYVLKNPFNLGVYAGFTLIIGTLSLFYRLAYQSWYPDLIAIGLEQKGYAVAGMIYPIVTIIMAPVAAFLYENLHIGYIFFIVTGITILAMVILGKIQETRKKSPVVFSFQQYRTDLREGFQYLKNEKGIRNIYTYMSVTNGASHGSYMITQAFYQTQPWLTVTMLGFLQSAELIGRTLAGVFQYRWEVPVKKRYALTKFVYTFYNVMDAALLFLSYPLMLANRFICGMLGSTTATIRHTAVQSYLPAEMRARVNAVFQVMFAAGMILFQFLAGWLGQRLSYPMVMIILASIGLTSMFLLIWIPDKENRPIYEATRKDETSLTVTTQTAYESAGSDERSDQGDGQN